MTGLMFRPDLEHDGHLVPGFVHLAAVDALDGEHVEDHRGQSMAISPWGCRAWRSCRRGTCWRACRRRPAALPDISRPTSNPSFMPSCFWAWRCVSARRPRPASPPSCCAKSRRYGLTSVTTTCRAPACRATAAAMMPIGPAPVIEHVLAQHAKLQGRMDGVAEGIENRLHVATESPGRGPRRWSSATRDTRRTRRAD